MTERANEVKLLRTPVPPREPGALGRLAAGVMLAACVSISPAEGQVVIKTATNVPHGSSWHRILMTAATQWKELSGGRVRMRLYPGGVAGDDAEVIRKIRSGSLGAALLGPIGLGEIEASIYALGVPMMYDSYDELYFVLEKMRPQLEAKLAAKGFVVLNWTDAGWIRFFSNEPVVSPEDLKRLKLYSAARDAEAVEIWRSAGFDPVSIPGGNIAGGLRRGHIDALGIPPQVAVVSQFYAHAGHMTDLPWQLLLGATVISASAWQQVSPDLRPEFARAFREAGARLRAEVRGNGERDIEAMRKRGLHVVPVDAEARRLWKETAETMYSRIRGEVVPPEAFDLAMKYRDEYRRAGSSRPD